MLRLCGQYSVHYEQAVQGTPVVILRAMLSSFSFSSCEQEAIGWLKRETTVFSELTRQPLIFKILLLSGRNRRLISLNSLSFI